jgi:polyisoprenoid-binding protein YceI
LTDPLTLRPARCVIEVTPRLLGLPLTRARFHALGGELADSMSITVDPASLRTPLLGRALRGHKGLSADRYPVIRFEARRSGDEFTGTVRVRQTDCALTLRTKTITAGQDAVIIWGHGRIGRSQPRTRRLNLPARLLGRRRLHVEIAAEFAR